MRLVRNCRNVHVRFSPDVHGGQAAVMVLDRKSIYRFLPYQERINSYARELCESFVQEFLPVGVIANSEIDFTCIGLGQSVCHSSIRGGESVFCTKLEARYVAFWRIQIIQMDNGKRSLERRMPGMRALGACQACQLGLPRTSILRTKDALHVCS